MPENQKRKIMGLFFLLIYQMVSAQKNSAITFQSLQEGLSNQIITCIMKDHKGYMWFGTYNGLNRYDGTNFVVYDNQTKSRSICYNTIGAIAEDIYHNIWVGTANGLNIYNRERDRFEKVSGLDITDTLNIKALYCDKQGNVWIGTMGDGMFVYDQSTKRLKHFIHNASDRYSLNSNFVKTIIADSKQNLWIGTREGLDYFDRKKNVFTHFVSSPACNSCLSHNTVSSLVIDRQGDLWIGTHGGGLNKLILKNNSYHFQHFRKNNLPDGLSNDFILSLMVDKEGNLWAGTENGGLHCMIVSSNSNKFIHYFSEEGNAKSLSSNSIWSLYEDNTGIMWIGTYNKGINIYDVNAEKFQIYQCNGFSKHTLVNNQVRDFAADDRGNLWIATDGGGISYYDIQTRIFSEPINNNELDVKAVQTVLFDSRQNLWAGTWGGGVYRFNRKGVRQKNYRFDGERQNKHYNVKCLYEDKSGRIWAGTSGNGLFCYNSVQDSFIQVTDGNKSSHLNKAAYINAILEDRNGQLWIGTSYGLFCMRGEPDEKYTSREYLYNSTVAQRKNSFAVNTLFEDSKGRLWIGTVDNLNLFNQNTHTFTIFDRQDGLPGTAVNGIVEDELGRLWVSTNHGISNFDPDKRSFKNYFKEDGLSTNEFYPNACIKTNTGDFFFGGNNGMISFSKDHISTNNIIPPVYITKFNLFNIPVEPDSQDSPLTKDISETTQLTLTHKQTSFSLEFAALNFTHSSRNQYAYLLEGFDTDWNYAGNRRMATYTNLNPGKYLFKVKGANNEGIWNETPTVLQITILPPIWATTWAYILYGLIFCILIWFFIHLRASQIAQAQNLRMERLHRIKSEELNKMKVQFFTNISHELRTPLTLILSPLEQILIHEQVNGDLKTKVNLVYNNAERLFGLVNELMDFTKLEEGKLKMSVQKGNIVRYLQNLFGLFSEQARQKQIDYRFSCQDENVEVWFDQHKIEKVVLNLLANAFKYTSEKGIIEVRVERVLHSVLNSEITECVKISVTDNGSGISSEYIDKIFDRFFQSPEDETRYNTGTGIGLALVKNLVELHHGTITVHSEKYIETCFEVVIPLGNSHFDKSEIVAEPMDISLSQVHPVTVATKPANVSLHPPVVLIVEDNFALRGYLASILSADYRVIEASDGVLGLRKAVEDMPDLIISDILMPQSSGIDLCKKVKADTRISHIPVILLTAKSTADDQIAGYETGADAYITKPFSIQILQSQVNQLIKSRQELYAHFSQNVYLRPSKLADNETEQQFIQKITDYILNNLTDNNLSVEGLAEAVNLSRSNMYRKIKSLTGKSVIEFIRMIRLKESLKLMETQKHSLAEIAYLTGFTSPAYFTKSFKEQYGKPPSEYLKN
jgi:ligand-binding sensor domain-containing protein/signal transduction histidine kinase/DNA-binding response OmpR family regulator